MTGSEVGSRRSEAQSFRDLVAWQRAMDLVDAVYVMSRRWPSEETFGLTAHVRRAVISVVANIAEEQGRSGSREFRHHLSLADGSLSEVEALPLVAARLRYIDAPTLDRAVGQVHRVWRPRRGLIQRLG